MQRHCLPLAGINRHCKQYWSVADGHFCTPQKTQCLVATDNSVETTDIKCLATEQHSDCGPTTDSYAVTTFQG